MVTSMLEKAIEIEGLLRIIRDGNPLPETYILLNMKTAELAEQAACLEEQPAIQDAHPTDSDADFVMAEPAPIPSSVPEVVFSVVEPTPKEDSIERTIEILSQLGEEDSDPDNDDLSLIEEDDILLTFEDANDAPGAIIAIQETTSAPESNITPNKEADPSPATEEKSGAHHPEPKGEGEGSAPAPKRRPKLKSAFSLNDRFLYARELFNGNMKMFDSTLDFIEGIEDYSIIEDYFYSELEWDPEKGHVAAFMEILRPHFKD
ncbi:MAG: hypothetical protein K2H22_00790 [Muribaculaceae bacterium]|nr:hypothetical protein [Muribaculaceae bacterium]